MATKEVMVSAPIIVLFYDRTFLANDFKSAWRSRRVYYIGLASTWLLLACLVHSTQDRGGTAGFGSPMPATLYWTTQAPAIVRYLRLSLWPHPLVFDYAFNRYWIQHPLATIPCVLAVASLLAATAWRFRRRSPEGFLGVWFFAILAPTSVMPGTRQALAEHRMYVALAPLVALAVVGLHRVSRPRTGLFAAAIAAASLVFAAFTVRRNEVYRSAGSLWSDTVSRVPDNPYAHNSLACVFFDEGKWQEARKELEAALAIDPEYAQAHANMGSVFTKLGRRPEAMAEYAEALRLDPLDPKTLEFRGYALTQFQEPERGIEDFKAAIRLKPDYAEAHESWGNALWSEGKTQEAAEHFSAAVRLRPDYAQAHNSLGNALAMLGRLPESVAEFQEAIRLKPEYSEAYNNLAITYAQMKRMPEAVEQFARAVGLDPSSIRARNNYGKALARLGRVAEARAQYEEAERLDPNDPEARENLGRLGALNPPP
jgi:tetratricopeptide (TPR) repeat protein